MKNTNNAIKIIASILVIALFGSAIFYFSKFQEHNIQKGYEEEKIKIEQSIKDKRLERKKFQEKRKKLEEEFIQVTSQLEQVDASLSGSINRDKARLEAINTLLTTSGTADSEPVIAVPGQFYSLIPTAYGNNNTHSLNTSHNPSNNNTSRPQEHGKPKTKSKHSNRNTPTKNTPQGIKNKVSRTQHRVPKKKQENKKISKVSKENIQGAKKGLKDKHFWATYNIAIPLIQKYEGLRLQAYKDGWRNGRQLYSIGYGSRSYAGERISVAEANRRLGYIVQQTVLRVRKHFPNYTATQQAALVSFAYNCDAGYRDVLRRGLGRHRLWCKRQGKRRLPGLVKRRAEEHRMLFGK